MNIHRRLHGKRPLRGTDFDRWLDYFIRAVECGWEGPGADRAKRVAASIAANMKQSLGTSD